MEVHDVFLPDLLTTVSVLVERKKIKTCRLKVYSDKAIKLSVPERTPKLWIEQFINSKSQWLSKRLQFLEQTKRQTAINEILSGASVCYLGEDLVFALSQSKKRMIYQGGKNLHICAPDIDDQKKLLAQFDKWWKEESLSVLNAEVDKFYPIFEKYRIKKPEIRLRKMKTLWGSCRPCQGVITFNQYLTRTPLACIEYVVLHELTHLLHPNHSKQFYGFLSNFMPYWQERKKALAIYIIR